MESTNSHETQLQFGPHRVHFVPPDMFRVFWHGEATAEHIACLFDFSARMVQNRRYFVIADLKGLTSASAEGRKLAAKDPRTLQIGALAMLNGNFQTRVVVTMMQRALQIFSKGHAAKMLFFNAEADALAWIDSERRRLDQV